MPQPAFWIVAGPNGAGKTTLVQAHPIASLLPRAKFLNPDDIARGLLTQRGCAGFADIFALWVECALAGTTCLRRKSMPAGIGRWQTWHGSRRMRLCSGVFDNSDENPDVPPRLMSVGRSGKLEFVDPSAGEALRVSLINLPRSP